MGYSICSEIGLERKDKFERMIKDAGFDSIHQFCADIGINQSNLYSNLDGTWGMSIKRMFKIANVLGVPIFQILEIFYPNEVEENMKLI